MSAQPAPSGSCLACGKPSTLRCSSCSAKSNIDLFFCSKEHQKLLWPYHRLVCGDRAHPFRLPAYSQEEADVLLERLRKTTTQPELCALQQKMRFALNASEMSQSVFDDKVQSLIGQDGLLPGPKSGNSGRRSSSDANSIEDLRLLSWEWYCDAYDSEDGDHPTQHFVEHFTHMYKHLTKNAPPVDRESVWHSRMCHHLAAPFPMQAKATQRWAGKGHPKGQKFVDWTKTRPTPEEFNEAMKIEAAYGAFTQFLRAVEGTEYAAFASIVRYNVNKPPPELLGSGQ
ncbi:hypothetical protein JCM10908_002083 [Rhodotorula pacifica]|uniref:zinc finger MYND domain-containing protein n=1 Tax=Rhodotorula pacifica TaxID=1495444 RepID=UPI0031735A06